jgi:hypothetical protein
MAREGVLSSDVVAILTVAIPNSNVTDSVANVGNNVTSLVLSHVLKHSRHLASRWTRASILRSLDRRAGVQRHSFAMMLLENR